ncbi:hypothetical protein BCV71DRAFT_184189, partial [Rhizopus microsporus]
TDKTFIYNIMCNYYQSKNEIALYVTPSGITALPLPNNQMSHSLIKISLSIDECFICKRIII